MVFERHCSGRSCPFTKIARAIPVVGSPWVIPYVTGLYPLVMTNSSRTWSHGPVEIVDESPLKKVDLSSSLCGSLPEGKYGEIHQLQREWSELSTWWIPLWWFKLYHWEAHRSRETGASQDLSGQQGFLHSLFHKPMHHSSWLLNHINLYVCGFGDEITDFRIDSLWDELNKENCFDWETNCCSY